MNSPRRTILILLILAAPCLGIAPQTVQQINAEATSDKLRVEIAFLPVTVTDEKGGLVTNLTHDLFTVLDEKVPQEIAFFLNTDEPASIGILFDVSKSIVEQTSRRLVAARESLSGFMRESHKSNEYFIICINRKPQLITDWTRDNNEMVDGLSKLAQMKHDNATALYDACILGIEKFQQRENKRQAIILITDGQDSISEARYNELQRALKKSSVQIYSINLSPQTDPLAGYGQEVLKELSKISGGLVYFPSTTDAIKDILKYIALEIRHKYLIGYYPTNARRDGQWHPVEIKVTRPKSGAGGNSPFYVRTRAGYYARKDTR